MKVLGIDPGEKRIGLAISDPTGTLSRPLGIIKHVSRHADARAILDKAEEEDVSMIVIGWALDSEGGIGYAARKSKRLADAVQELTCIPVKMWDESGTTQSAIESRIAMQVSKKKRQGHLDDLAASILLQDFLIHYEPGDMGDDQING